MAGFEVSPPELEGAAVTLGGVEATFGCPSRAIGELGSPDLEGALGDLYRTLDQVALAMGEAIGQASHNLTAGASAYVRTDDQAMPSGAR